MARQSLIFRLALLVIAGALMEGCVILSGDSSRIVDREERRFHVEGKPDVKLSTMDGSIEIRPWDRPEVLVVIEKRAVTRQAARYIEVRASQDGNHVSLDVRMMGRGHDWFWGGSGNARLIVSLPATSDLQASTGDGAIDLERITGAISLRSGDGSIRARNASGSIAARSGDGSIRLDDITGAVEANTGDGGISVTGAITGLRARSGDGRIAVRADSGSSTDTDWDISTSDGTVLLEVSDNFGADLDARTGDGRVRFDGVTLSNVIGEFGRHHAAGRIGPGGHLLRVRTGDGSIILRRGLGR